MKTLLLFLLNLAELAAFGQTDFQSGYIITNKGDTLRVFIDTGELSACHYKMSLNDADIHILRPSQLTGYFIDKGRHFESLSTKQPNSLKDTVFMECLLDGFASLYLYDRSFYVRKADTLLYELRNESQYVDNTVINNQEMTDRVYKSKNYLRILTFLLNDCPTLKKKLNATRLEAGSLVKLLEEYNNCINYSYTNYLNLMPMMKVNIEVTGGVLFSRLHLTQLENGRNEFLFDGKAFNSTSVQFGGTAYFSNPRSKERFSFVLGILASQSKFNIEDSIITSTYRYYYSGVVDFFNLSLPFGLRYTFTNNKTQPFLRSSIGPNFLINPSSAMVKTTISDAGIRSDYPYELFNFPKMFYSFEIAAGLLRPLSDSMDGMLEVKYAPPMAVDMDNTVSSRYSTICLTLGLRFK